MDRLKVFLTYLCISLIWAAAFLSLGSSRTFACECQQKNDFELEFALATAVFVGEVLEIEDVQNGSTVVFSVQKMWKGAGSNTVVIRTKNQGCAFSFRKNESYLVYAVEDGGDLRTTKCSRTVPIAYGSDDIKKLSDDGWSRSVNGLRARLSVLPSEQPGSPICRVFIEMENVGKGIGPMKVSFHTDKLEPSVISATTHKPLGRVNPPYSGFAPNWEPIPIPYAGSIRFEISYPGMGVSRDARAAIDIGSSNTWVIPAEGSYLLSARFEIPAEKGDHPYLNWSGTLELPRVRIPVCKAPVR
jgi:hypothetical protein